MAEGYQKSYEPGDDSFVPAFTIDPTNGLAALDVQFEDTSFRNDIIIYKEYTPAAGETPIQKEYL